VLPKSPLPLGLHPAAHSPVDGLAVLESRVVEPAATVVCIHGGLDRAGSFARMARRLENFDVVAYDRRGYQGSRGLTPLGLARHVDDAVAVARAERVHTPVILFGHSFGGVVALGAALFDAHVVDLVVAFESPLPWILQRHGSRRPESDDAALEVERFFRRMVSDRAWERLHESERVSRRLDGPALVDDLSQLSVDHPPFELANLSVATVYAYGENERSDYYRALTKRLGSVSPLIEAAEIPGAGHGAHLSSPDQLTKMIDQRWEQVCESV